MHQTTYQKTHFIGYLLSRPKITCKCMGQPMRPHQCTCPKQPQNDLIMWPKIPDPAPLLLTNLIRLTEEERREDPMRWEADGVVSGPCKATFDEICLMPDERVGMGNTAFTGDPMLLELPPSASQHILAVEQRDACRVLLAKEIYPKGLVDVHVHLAAPGSLPGAGAAVSPSTAVQHSS
jgi:hypothetical protein